MIDPNTAMVAAGEGAKAVSKLEEIVQKVFGPRWTKKQADADAYADEKKLQLIRDNPDMEIVFANGQMNARLRTPEALAFRAEQRQLAESVRQEENLENILEKAEKELPPADEISDTPVDDDWLTRFFGIAKDVGSEDLQFIWGKILAGEITKPGSFSLRTLETIRNISADEAKIFETVLPFVMSTGGNQFIPTDLTEYSEYGFKYGHIMRLDECGLINSTGMASTPIKIPANCKNETVVCTKSEVLTASNMDSAEITSGITAYPLTCAAIELMSILEYSSNHEFFIKFSEKLHNSKSLSKTEMEVFEIIYDDNGEALFDTAKPIYTFCPINNRNSGNT